MRWYYIAGSQSEREDPINHSVICALLFYYLRGGLLSPGVVRAHASGSWRADSGPVSRVL